MQNNARTAAVKVLERCRKDKAWSSAALDSTIRRYQLDGRDAAFLSRLCLGVMQNERLLDFYIDTWCSTKTEPLIRDILRLGAYQIIFLDRVPDSAAVNETVSLCRTFGRPKAMGLINAVLRRISENKASLPQPFNSGTPQHLAIKYSHPDWLAEYICNKYGYAFTEDFFAANNVPSGLSLQINTLKISLSEYTDCLKANGIPFQLCPVPQGCVELSGGSATSLPGFQEGLFYIQDRAARIAADISAPKPGMNVLDACACPGGKSFAAALSMQNTGKIIACDIHDKKLSLVNEGAARLGIGIIETRCHDARSYEHKFEQAFDIVIADVPCSGLGVIAKKPEIRNKKPEEIAGLPKIQADILENLCRYVRPGGVLLYSTCTVISEENEWLVGRFLSEHPEFKAERFYIGDKLIHDGMYTFWPNIDGTDGFFVSKLRKEK